MGVTSEEGIGPCTEVFRCEPGTEGGSPSGSLSDTGRDLALITYSAKDAKWSKTSISDRQAVSDLSDAGPYPLGA